MLAKSVKEAAQPDLASLAQEAGFRLARGRTYHCARHRDCTPSAHRYGDAIHCFSCGERFDAIDLARIIIAGSAAEAIRWLAVRYGIPQQAGSKPRPQFSEAEYTKAELFRTGFCWALEHELAKLKQPLQGTGPVHGEQIFRLTALLAQAKAWSPRLATAFYVELRRRDPRQVKRWTREALEFQLQLATAIAYAGTGMQAAA